MKKVLLAALVLMIVCGSVALSAKESEYYYVSVPIEKIYRHRKGYVVMYRKSMNRMAQAYVPHEWFTSPGGKADFVSTGNDRSWPHMSVYYKNGEFSHIRLYVKRANSHDSWGIVSFTTNLDEQFDGAEDITLEF